MKNTEIAGIFNNIADLLEIKAENPFRIRAYRKAAFIVTALGKDISSLSDEELLELPGVGCDLASKIEEYVRTGRMEAYERLKLEIPESLTSLLAIPGLGPKTVAQLYKEYNIRDIESLERLAREHRLSGLPGIKDKTEQSILKGIEMIRRYSVRHPLGKVLPLANEIREYLSTSAPLEKLSIAGSLRMWKDTIKDIDLISTSKDPEAVMRVFTHMPEDSRIIARGDTKSSVLLKAGIQVDIRVVDEDSYGSAMAYFTGSKEHNIRLREIASKAGLKINEYGIFREADGRKLGGRLEEDIYHVLGFFLGKAIPYFFITLIDVLVAILMGQVLFGVVMKASFWLMILASGIYILVALSIGLLISVKTHSQLVANQLAVLVTYLPSLLLSDFVFPQQNMPVPLKVLSTLVPATYYIDILNGLYLRNLSLFQLWPSFLVLAGMAAVLLLLNIRALQTEGL